MAISGQILSLSNMHLSFLNFFSFQYLKWNTERVVQAGHMPYHEATPQAPITFTDQNECKQIQGKMTRM